MRSLRVLASSLAINFAYTSPSSIYSWHCVLNARSLDRIFASSVPCFLRFGRRVCVLPSASFPLPHPSPSRLSLFLRIFLDVSLSLSIPLCMTESRESGKRTAPGSLDRWLAGTMFHGREQKGRWGGWRKEGKMTRKKWSFGKRSIASGR